MLKNIKLVWDIFLLSHRNDPKITLYELLHGLCLNVRRVVNVIMPAYIVNLICGEREGKVILAAAVSYGVLLCLLGCGEKSFKLLQEAHGFRACNLLRLSMNKKFMRLDYADTEKSEVIDSFEEAKDSMWEFTDVGYVLFDDIAGNLLSFVFMSYILTDINPLIYVFVLILVGINLYVQHRKNAFFHQVELEEKRAEKHMNYMAGLMQDYKVGKEIRLFQTSDFMIEKYIHFSRKYKALIDRKEDYAVKTSLIQAVLYLGQLFAVYISAVKKYMEGSLLIGSFLLYISSINALTESIKNLLAALIELSKVSYYYKDYEKYMSIPENIYASGKDSVETEGDYVIELKDVSYYYPGVEKAALDRISFRITSRDKVGIVGENGSGKSTLVKILLRLYDPVEGAVYLNGRDIRTIEYDSYLKIFNTVFQDFSIFAYSILENIIFDQNADWEKIDKILKVTGFGRQMEKYKNGIESRVTKVLDDEGVNLSGGEQQLLAISRAFYRDAKILVFDEPTAALDPMKEAEIFELIHDMAEEKAAVFCAHRMSSTRFCDKILVLDEGLLKESGTHGELMERRGIYYSLFTRQASFYK